MRNPNDISPPETPTTRTPDSVRVPVPGCPCPLPHVPTEHQRTMEVNSLIFSSEFDSGNLRKAKFDDRTNEYHLYQSRDAQDTAYEAPYTTWFHFSVKGAKPGQLAQFVIMNMNKQNRLYKQDYRPLYKVVPNDVSDPSLPIYNNWQRLPSPVSIKPHAGENLMSLKFKFKFDVHFLKQFEPKPTSRNNTSSNNNNNNTPPHPPPMTPSSPDDCNFTVYFAFCFPQSYTESQNTLHKLDVSASALASKGIYYHREALTLSLDKRRVDMITLSNLEGKMEGRDAPFHFTPSTVPESESHQNLRAHKFDLQRKKVCFISSRVHPGETPAQFVFDGILNFLLSDDVRAKQLRKQYVFKLVPMLNPDGVARGHYRCDSRGVNLNRFYDEPCPNAHPSIYAVKHFLSSNASNLRLYLDLHAHASKRGCFIYGNHLEKEEDQLANQLYVKMISMNSPWFEYKGSDFSQKGMSGKDKRDNGLTKEGSGRVGIYMATGIPHCYTLECNYNVGLNTGVVGNCSKVRFPESMTAGFAQTVFGESPVYGYSEGVRGLGRYLGNPSRMTTPKYNREMFCNVGEGCVIALLDMSGTNPICRLGGNVPSTNPGRLTSGSSI
eukprot:CAMPEP_0118637980 /NCGR_PEP_ID=MMETSP0785-20121206/3440_1 /TAXON_ID=91992 /ORGANISM="Bolidomonas pacifica, Strain CCMP 1866" /LENGTH=606 /DNA_ID=CAMNT_0006529199 /DNA_START=38 /DNA_END=1854 /DNA_ORIENTATION=-